MARSSKRSATEPTPGSLADLQAEADPRAVARSVVLRRLSSTARTRKDLHDDLLKREIPEAIADEVLDRFTELGLINDSDYAELFVASRRRSRGTARPVLRQELRRKGVGDDEIHAALEDISDEDEFERARALVLSRHPSLARFDAATKQRRLMSLLMRRGYSGSVAASVVREVVQSEVDLTELALGD
ncbi:MAG: regulatory protein RecX [Actinomycetota bacterium]|nr:regulatory protein RecX [Actinomycetota bacterium]